jgi:class 3 adenylate cyclase
MAAAPRLATAALVIHNNVIRKAQYSNAGVVLQQEGDSFTVAFHKPLDAVTFCLQVRHEFLQLLNRSKVVVGSRCNDHSETVPTKQCNSLYWTSSLWIHHVQCM